MLRRLPLFALFLALPLMHAQNATPVPQQDNGYTLSVNADLVLTNVVVRDAKTGELVKGLDSSAFTIFENGRPQKINSFDFQSIEMAVPLKEGMVSGLAGTNQKAAIVANSEELRNHRLIVFFFDLTSMQPEDLERAVVAAQEFVDKKLQPADLIALVSLSESLKVDQDFTADKTTLKRVIAAYNGSEGQGFAPGATASSNQVEDASGYTPDESEYNDINTDRELYALRAIARSLERIEEKKSLLYFSGGISRDGIENQASLRGAINSSVRANLSIYSVDVRGLQAVSPLGDASTGSLRGTGAFNGGALANNMNSNFASQEVMSTLSTDTGGKAFFDSNDFSPAFAQVQKDNSAYYAIGFRSTNSARDGKFRKLTIKLNKPGLKLEYRPGYYAPADFTHSGHEDRERQLQDQLASDLPATDIPVYLDAFYFRLSESRYFMPVSIVIPGSQIPFVKGGARDKATLDIVGEVIDEAKRPVGDVRETVKLAVDQTQEVRRKNVQYTTSFSLPPGKYTIKFVVRENQSGQMGSFVAEMTLPELKKQTLKMSTILLASQRVPSQKDTPLVRTGQEYVPNISHVFRQGQHMYLLFEVYEPMRMKLAENAQKPPKGTPPAVNVLTSLELIQGATKIYETPLVEAHVLNQALRDCIVFELDVPLDALKPGQYIAQLNVIDDTAASFAFPRFALLVKEAPPAAVPQTVAPESTRQTQAK